MGDIGTAYATAAEYLAATRRASSDDNAQIGIDLGNVSTHVERALGYAQVGFNRDAVATTRIMRVPEWVDDRLLWLDVPLAIAPTSVKIDTDNDGDFTDETTLSLTEFTGDVIFLPMGYADGVAQPITGIELTSQATAPRGNRWISRDLVQIVGIHGWPAVPGPIKSATIALTSILRLETLRATGQITNVDNVLNASPEAQRIVRDLMATYKSPASYF